MNIIVTGGYGFIGRVVCRQLREHGHHVFVIDSLVPQVHGAYWDRRDPDLLARSLGSAASEPGQFWNDAEALIHLAAEVGVAQSQYEPAKYVRSNCLETAQLWERILKQKNIRKIVVAGSMSAYGEGSYLHNGNVYDESKPLVRSIEEGWNAFHGISGEMKPVGTSESKRTHPASIYAATKLHAEQYSMILSALSDIPTVALRFFNVVGPGQAINNPYTGCAMNFLNRIANGKNPIVTEDGMQTRDFIDVRDISSAVCGAVKSEELSGVFNVGTGDPSSVGWVAETLCAFAYDIGMPNTVPEISNQYRKGDVRHCYSDSSALYKAIGWRAKHNPKESLLEVAKFALSLKGNVSDVMGDTFDDLKRRGIFKNKLDD